MSSTPRHQFPSLQQKPAPKQPGNAQQPAKGSEPGAPAPPPWLARRSGSPNDDIRTLVSLLQPEPQQKALPPAQEPPDDPPEWEPPPPPPPPQPQAARQQPQQPRPQAAPQFQQPELEEPVGRLPGPPRMGSLVPGGRSQPPPAQQHLDASMTEAIQAFASAAVELAIARTANLLLLEGQLLDLSIEVAEALIEKEVEDDPKLHSALARAALQSIGGDTSHVTLRTSPDGYEAICAVFGGPEVEARGVRVHVVADSTIPGLGCVVEGDNVRVDATVSERLRAVRRAFEEERRRSAENVE
jgi:vacuolar-type H+-ATPase subunit E/Vma4